MYIIDFSQTAISNIMVSLGNHKNADIDVSMVRHMVLNSIRSYRSKFGHQYGEMIIACDSTNYWRKQLFPYYKANRKKSHEESEINWKQIFHALNVVREELKQHFPYRIIEIESVEADDIIGTLCMKFGNTSEPILILSRDSDFYQLHRYDNVFQYDIITSKIVRKDNAEKYLKEHIINGDKGDGIPNFLSPDNCLVIGERQKSIMQKKVQVWIDQEPEAFCDEVQLKNYRRNEKLIDFRFIPDDIQDKILREYKNQKGKTASSQIMKYFMDNRLRLLLDSINDFV